MHQHKIDFSLERAQQFHSFIHLPSTHVFLFWETDQDYVLSIYGLSAYLMCCWCITASNTNTYHLQMQKRNKNTDGTEAKDPTCIPTCKNNTACTLYRGDTVLICTEALFNARNGRTQRTRGDADVLVALQLFP